MITTPTPSGKPGEAQLSNSTTAGLHATMDLNTPGRTPWGIRAVLSSQIAAGTALVANLADAAVVFSREPATVFIDPYSQSNKNLVRFIAEERLALGVTRPTALLRVTFNGTS